MTNPAIIDQLFEINAVKFGTFTLKSGMVSPFYIDLRLIISYPKLLRQISEALWRLVADCDFDLICGVPYTAFPIATAMSIDHDVPMVMRRKEKKDYGTKKIIEGVFKKGQTCLIVEDLITSGLSIQETTAPLEELELTVKDITLVIDREQGGVNRLKKSGYEVHALMTITSILQHLEKQKKVEKEMIEKVRSFIHANQV